MRKKSTNNKEKAEQLAQAFKEKTIITTGDIVEYCQSTEPNVLKSTINWRVYEWVQNGVLTRVSRGHFKLGEVLNYVPDLSKKALQVWSHLISGLPFVRYCVWDAASIIEFADRIQKINMIFVDVERGSEESTYHLLKQRFQNVWLKPKKSLLESHIVETNKPIVVRVLVSEAPILLAEGIPTAPLEKILVDVVSDPEFYFLNGYEIEHIFGKALTTYTVDENKMKRYASRKRKQEKLAEVLRRIPSISDL
ncbi:MAG: hypothetical protein HQ472_06920 [Ignavibacteria bacterium]|nr:hypothetical protein [Ignavibacteria bacterium]